MKLWSSTANGPQRSRCNKIGSPEGEKMPIMIKIKFNNRSDSLDHVKNHANKQISLKINNGIGIFYE